MYPHSYERVPSMRGNQPALRIAIFGGVALALFATLFFRLWFLQVINGSKYLAEAKNNRTREFRVNAPRGQILDRNGNVLVANPQKLPEAPRPRQRELARLADLTHTSLRHLQQTMREEEELAPGAPVTLRRDVGRYLVYYVEENRNLFPGVDVQTVFVRRYPNGALAAHILGNVGEITEEELKEPRYRGLQPGEEVGQEGVENTYDRYLRGTPGMTRIQVDAFGEPTPGGKLVSRQPVPGDILKLTADAKIQAAGQAAMEEKGLPGGFVTMDVHGGEILGFGSFPTFDPTMFTHPLTQKEVDATYLNPSAPLTDRAIAGLYPTGSTFK